MQIPSEVESILNWWYPRIQKVLAAKLKSVYLYGSITLGDYNSGWSDVDVCVLLESAIAKPEADGIIVIHDEMSRLYLQERQNGWQSGQVVEGQYVPERLAADPAAEDLCLYAYGSTRQLEVGHPFSPFDRYMLSQHGACWQGAAVSFAPARREELVEMSQRDAASLGASDAAAEASAIWLVGMIAWTARAYVFWRDGVMMSKSGALEHEIAAGSPYVEAYALALKVRREGSAAAGNYDRELLRLYKRLAPRASKELAEIII